MIEINIRRENSKKEIKRIDNLKDFYKELKLEGYKTNQCDYKIKEEIKKKFNLDNEIIEILYKCINDKEIIYRANNIKDFIDYIKTIILFESVQEKLYKKISQIKKININRIEYEREISVKDNVEEVIKDIEETRNRISKKITKQEEVWLDNLEKELDKEYIYSKDIELLKKIICVEKENVKEEYNEKTKIKTISIEIPNKIEHKYIKPNKGSIEYHQHLNSNIPRMKRLIKNMDKYMEVDEKEKGTFTINQSKLLQDSINMAVGIFDNKEFKAVSGSIDIENYCKSSSSEEGIFKSNKVNKLGELGVGYNRINDSEKKIFEEIHRQIEAKIIKDEGNLTLYSKFEPCPSCYFVISQFSKKHPNIDIEVKYDKTYGKKIR